MDSPCKVGQFVSKSCMEAYASMQRDASDFEAHNLSILSIINNIECE
jgi:hypothetical protein